ncbi:MAG: hypothetical protein ACI4L6_00485 [Candidatus Onthoplasma sp.]
MTIEQLKEINSELNSDYKKLSIDYMILYRRLEQEKQALQFVLSQLSERQLKEYNNFRTKQNLKTLSKGELKVASR